MPADERNSKEAAKRYLRVFDQLEANIESEASLLCSEHDELTFSNGRINGYRVAPAVYSALYTYLLHQANLAGTAGKKPRHERRSQIWFNFGGWRLNNASVKRFDVARRTDGSLHMKATLVEIAHGLAPFENLASAACCGNHCSSGCYDICPTYR
jgi:hypothetical protein